MTSEPKAKSSVSAPPINPESKAFWDAANDERLTLGYCGACGRWHFYPRSICPLCHSAGAVLRDCSGLGRIYSCSATLRGVPEPYVIAYVELDEGPRILSNIIGCAPSDAQIGERVEVCFGEAEGGQKVPMVRPSAQPHKGLPA